MSRSRRQNIMHRGSVASVRPPEMGKNNSMKRMAKSLALVVLWVAIAGCGATVRSVVTQPGVRLRQYNPVTIVLRTGSGNVSLTGGGAGGIIAGSISDGEAQAVRALESFRFELLATGFQFVDQREAAAAVIEFSIGSIRYDPLVGWIADQALANFKDAKTGATVAMFRADGQAITPTVNRLVSSISKAIRAAY